MNGKITVSVIAALLCVSLLAASSSGVAIITADEVKPGMKGYGYTVFKGVEPERFDVEVIDVLKRAMPKQDIILVKVSGHDLENTGIYQGMSGSPIYIDDRLMGALAYGWDFTKIPIAGITPIQNMLAELNRPLENQSSAPVAKLEPAEQQTAYHDGRLVPISSPVMVSGLPAAMISDLAEALKPYHLTPMQGGSGAADEETPKIKPGSALGVALTRGDITMTAIGTVTWVEGRRVLAFGHPFMFGGEIRFPITGARIVALMPRLDISMKMGQATNEIGSLLQDRQSCIVGDLDSRARMVPFDVHIKNNRTGREENFHTELAWETSLTAQLIPITLQSALMSAEANAGENTAQTSLEIKFKNYPPFILTNTYFNGKGPFQKTMLDSLVRMIYNPFEKVEIESLKMDISITPDIRIATIKRIWLEENVISPGGVGKLHVVLKPFGASEEVEKVVDVPISDDYDTGAKVMVGVAGGSVVIPPIAPPVDFKGVIRLFGSLYKSTDMVVVQQLATTGARIEGAFMPDLPSAAIKMLGASNTMGPIIQSDFRFTPVSTDWVILGRAVLQAQVGEK